MKKKNGTTRHNDDRPCLQHPKNNENLEKREHLIKICEAMGQCPVCNQNISNILFHLETQHSRDEP